MDDKDKKVKAEFKRLEKLYSSCAKDDVSRAKQLMERAAFLAVTIQELENDINKNGYEEYYQNGENQKGKKRSAAADLHVSYTKNLVSVTKQLQDMLQPVTTENCGDEFDNFG